jgi:RNA polymerase sigma-70 factor (ECF subfamily)
MNSSNPVEPAAEPAAAAAAAEGKSFRGLLARVLEGCPGAAEQLQKEYGRHIKRVVRHRLPRQLRARFDSIDFVQDVWASFYRLPGRQFNEPEHLIAYLTRMAHNKVADATDDMRTTKRNVGREESLTTGVEGVADAKVFARDGTPSEAAIGHELWEQMLEGQLPAYRLVLTMLRDGQSQTEVADRTKLSRKTIQRILARALEKVKP